MNEVINGGGTGNEGQRPLYYSCPAGKPGVTLTSSCSSTSESMGDGSASSSSTSSPSSMAAAAQAGRMSGSGPICKNCLTSTTPLWRRDENGAVLCNACGLFLKLHGRPRPISLKTDVIKSRNRKGTHHHHQQQQQQVQGETSRAGVEKQPKGAQIEEKKRKSPAQPVLEVNGKRLRTEEDSESKDICSAANTLEILMSGESKPKIKPKTSVHPVKQDPVHPVLSPSQSNTQLPHLSALLGDVRSQSNPAAGVADQSADRSVTSPEGAPAGKALNFHRGSIHEHKFSPYAHESIPISKSSSSSSIRGSSVPQRHESPPRARTPPGGSTQPGSMLHVPVATPLPGSESQEKPPLTAVLQKEEDVIRLKTRINELELVTDLYKRHIFELDEKCKGLQCEIQSLKN